MYYLYQAIGFAGTIILALSFQQRTRERIHFLMMFSSMFFAIHFFLIVAYTGCIMNIISIMRSFIFYNYRRKWARSRLWLVVFLIVSIVAGILTWKNAWSCLPVIGMLLTTVGLWMKNPARIRVITISGLPCWFTYNLVSGSIAGVVTETLNIISLATAIFRYDIIPGFKKKLTDGK